MPEKFILSSSEKDDVFLGRNLSLKETANVLDILRKVDGLTFDFHKKLYPKDGKRDEINSLVQETYKKFISKNSKISAKSVDYVETFGSQFLANSESYLLEIRYSFHGMKTLDMMESGFELGCVRVDFGNSKSAAIVTFEGRPTFHNPNMYLCELNNISYAIKIHQGRDSEIVLAEKYQSKLYNLLESKLLIPEFREFDD